MQCRRLDWVAAHATGVVVDVGCADGAIASRLSMAAEYIGLDYPTTADHLYLTRPAIYADASRLPLGNDVCDTLLLLDVIEHLVAPEAAIQEASRVLRFGGTLLITIPFSYPLHDQPHDYQRFTAYGLQQRLHGAGFSQVTLEEVGDAVTTAAANFSMAVTQGAIDACVERRWRIIVVPIVPLVVLLANVFGWAIGGLLPALRFMPESYYVRAER